MGFNQARKNFEIRTQIVSIDFDGSTVYFIYFSIHLRFSAIVVDRKPGGCPDFLIDIQDPNAIQFAAGGSQKSYPFSIWRYPPVIVSNDQPGSLLRKEFTVTTANHIILVKVVFSCFRVKRYIDQPLIVSPAIGPEKWKFLRSWTKIIQIE